MPYHNILQPQVEETATIVSHMKRINRGLLSKFEETLFWRVVTKVPSWVVPDMLSFLAVISFCANGLFYYLAGTNIGFLWLVNLGLVGHWFFDSLDGKLAKFRHRSRPNYGYYLDHLLDSLGACLTLLGLYFSSLSSTNWGLASLALIMLLMMNAYLVHSVTQTLYLSYGLLGGSEAEFLLIIVNIICWSIKNKSFSFFGLTYSFIDWFFFLANPLLLIMLVSSFIKNISWLRKEKPQY
jgi:archaetidylinositol phosphate synthase